MRDLHAALFVVTLIGLCYEVRHARRHWRSYAWHRVPLSVLALTAAFFVRRFTWFMVLPVILLARNLESALQTERGTWSLVGQGACVAFAALAFSLFGYRITVTKAWSDSHVASGYPPRDLTEFVADCGLRGNLYNPYGWGGYCIYHLYPNCRVFLDGRDHVYYRAGPVVFADSMLIEIGSPAAANVLERINVNIVLIPNSAFSRSHRRPPSVKASPA